MSFLDSLQTYVVHIINFDKKQTISYRNPLQMGKIFTFSSYEKAFDFYKKIFEIHREAWENYNSSVPRPYRQTNEDVFGNGCFFYENSSHIFNCRFFSSRNNIGCFKG